jgi:hypothetical protein
VPRYGAKDSSQAWPGFFTFLDAKLHVIVTINRSGNYPEIIL